MQKIKILFLDSTHNILPEKLKHFGFEVYYDLECQKSELLTKISNYNGLIIRSRLKIDKEIIEQGKNLQFIARLGSGLENIDVDYASSKGIFCINSPEGNRDAVAEHTIGMLLCLSKKILKSHIEVTNGKWLREENRGFELKGKNIAIIGYGNMGSAFAKRLLGFDINIMAYDKYKSNFGNDFVAEVQLSEVFKKADIVSFHIPYNKENHYFVDKNFISQFEKKILILNTSRGKILNTEDLVSSLKNGKVIGTGLDVIEYENVSLQNSEKEKWNDSMLYLSQSNNVVLTPHIAGWSLESNIKLSEIIFEKIIKIIKIN